jgi:hypothetical protein
MIPLAQSLVFVLISVFVLIFVLSSVLILMNNIIFSKTSICGSACLCQFLRVEHVLQVRRHNDRKWSQMSFQADVF